MEMKNDTYGIVSRLTFLPLAKEKKGMLDSRNQELELRNQSLIHNLNILQK